MPRDAPAPPVRRRSAAVVLGAAALVAVGAVVLAAVLLRLGEDPSGEPDAAGVAFVVGVALANVVPSALAVGLLVAMRRAALPEALVAAVGGVVLATTTAGGALLVLTDDSSTAVLLFLWLPLYGAAVVGVTAGAVGLVHAVRHRRRHA